MKGLRTTRLIVIALLAVFAAACGAGTGLPTEDGAGSSGGGSSDACGATPTISAVSILTGDGTELAIDATPLPAILSVKATFPNCSNWDATALATRLADISIVDGGDTAVAATASVAADLSYGLVTPDAFLDYDSTYSILDGGGPLSASVAKADGEATSAFSIGTRNDMNGDGVPELVRSFTEAAEEGTSFSYMRPSFDEPRDVDIASYSGIVVLDGATFTPIMKIYDSIPDTDDFERYVSPVMAHEALLFDDGSGNFALLVPQPITASVHLFSAPAADATLPVVLTTLESDAQFELFPNMAATDTLQIAINWELDFGSAIAAHFDGQALHVAAQVRGTGKHGSEREGAIVTFSSENNTVSAFPLANTEGNTFVSLGFVGLENHMDASAATSMPDLIVLESGDVTQDTNGHIWRIQPDAAGTAGTGDDLNFRTSQQEDLVEDYLFTLSIGKLVAAEEIALSRYAIDANIVDGRLAVIADDDEVVVYDGSLDIEAQLAAPAGRNLRKVQLAPAGGDAYDLITLDHLGALGMKSGSAISTISGASSLGQARGFIASPTNGQLRIVSRFTDATNVFALSRDGTLGTASSPTALNGDDEPFDTERIIVPSDPARENEPGCYVQPSFYGDYTNGDDTDEASCKTDICQSTFSTCGTETCGSSGKTSEANVGTCIGSCIEQYNRCRYGTTCMSCITGCGADQNCQSACDCPSEY